MTYVVVTILLTLGCLSISMDNAQEKQEARELEKAAYDARTEAEMKKLEKLIEEALKDFKNIEGVRK